jgi:hypothetical protein
MTHNLDWIRSFYAIQHPPANLAVTDLLGRTTGRRLYGAPLEQVPGSGYFAHRKSIRWRASGPPSPERRRRCWVCGRTARTPVG